MAGVSVCGETFASAPAFNPSSPIKRRLDSSSSVKYLSPSIASVAIRSHWEAGNAYSSRAFQRNGLALISYGCGKTSDQPIFENACATDRTRVEVFPMLDQIRGPRHRQMQLQIVDDTPKDLQILAACPVTREM